MNALASRLRDGGPWPWTAAALAALLVWDSRSGDLWLARLMASGSHFPWRDHWLTVQVLHEGGRWLGWLVVMWVCTSVGWPTGCLRRLPMMRRVELAIGTLLALLLVVFIKRMSETSCPWDLREFGGVAHYVSHWRWGQVDGGAGHCFPAGHASAGFSLIGGYWAWRQVDDRMARRWLQVAMAAGAVLGLSQQWRGAHYFSHTAWTAWLCWTAGAAVHAMATARQAVPALTRAIRRPGRF